MHQRNLTENKKAKEPLKKGRRKDRRSPSQTSIEDYIHENLEKNRQITVT